MEDMMKILMKIQEDIECQKQEMAKVQDNLRTLNENINQKLENVEHKTKDLEEKLEKQQILLDRVEQQLKKRNIVLFGLEEKEKHYSELEEMVLHMLNKILKIECNKRDIELVKRIGRSNGKIRPVVLTVTTMGLKIQILRNKKLLNGTTIYLKEDYTSKVLQKRKELQQEFLTRREQGEKVVMKYDKIISLDSKSPEMEKQTTKQANPNIKNNKRKQNNSPEIPPQKQGLTNNISKKNKFNMESYFNSKLSSPISVTPSPKMAQQMLQNSTTTAHQN